MVISNLGQTTVSGTAKTDFRVDLLVVFRNIPASRGLTPLLIYGVDAICGNRPPPMLVSRCPDTPEFLAGSAALANVLFVGESGGTCTIVPESTPDIVSVGHVFRIVLRDRDGMRISE